MALPEWDGELTSVRYDRGTGAWFVIGVHSTRLGPASGGTRAMVYPSPGDAVADRTRAIGDTLTGVFADARTHGTTTVTAAQDLAARTLTGEH